MTTIEIDVKQKTVYSLEQLAELETTIIASAESTLSQLFAHRAGATDIMALARLKFDPCGCDPLDSARPLNFIEQLNQSFTYSPR